MNRIIYISFFLIFIMNSDVSSQDTTALHKITIYEDMWYKRYIKNDELVKYVFYVDDEVFNSKEFKKKKEGFITDKEKAHLESLKTKNKFVFIKDSLFGIKNYQGDIISPAKYDKFNKTKQGTFYAFVKNKGCWILFDQDLNQITTCKYSNIFCLNFSKNKCFIEKAGKYGVIDTTGKETIPPIYSNLKYVGDSLLLAINDKTKNLVTYNNKLLFSGKNKKIKDFECFEKKSGEDSFCRFEENGKQGVVDNTGKTIFQPKYLKIKLVQFQDGEDKINTFLLYESDSWSLWQNGKTILKGIHIIHPYFEGNFSDFIYNFNFLIYEKYGNYGIINNRNNNLTLTPFKGNTLKFIRTSPLEDFNLSKGSNLSYSGNKINQEFLYISKDSLWGICDLSGIIKIQPRYEKLFYFNTSLHPYHKKLSWDHTDELFLAMSNKKWGIIDINGKIIFDFLWDEIKTKKWSDFIIVKSKDRFGLIDQNGNQFLKTIYQKIDRISFNTGSHYAKIKKNDKWGLIDLESGYNITKDAEIKKLTSEIKKYYNANSISITLKGKRFLNPEYDKIETLEFDKYKYFKIKKDSCWFLMKPNGEMIIKNCCKNISTMDFEKQKLLKVKYDNYWKLLSANGKPILNSKFKNVLHFGNSIYAQNNSGKWGTILSEAHIKHDFIYEDIVKINRRGKGVNIARIKKNGKYALMDKNGIIATPFNYDDIQYLTGDNFNSQAQIYYKVKNNKKWGVISLTKDSTNQYQIINKLDVSYDNFVINLSSNRGNVKAKSNGKWGLYDFYMNPIIDTEFNNLIIISRTKYFAYKNKNECGIIRGNKYIPISIKSKGRKEKLGFDLYKQRKGCLSGLLNSKDSLLLDYKYLQIERFNKKGKHFPYDMAKINKDGLWGYILTDGRFFVKPQYEDLRAYQENMARVMKDGKWGFIDLKGKLVIPLIYDNVEPFTNGKSKISLGGKVYFIDNTGKIIRE